MRNVFVSPVALSAIVNQPRQLATFVQHPPAGIAGKVCLPSILTVLTDAATEQLNANRLPALFFKLEKITNREVGFKIQCLVPSFQMNILRRMLSITAAVLTDYMSGFRMLTRQTTTAIYTTEYLRRTAIKDFNTFNQLCTQARLCLLQLIVELRMLQLQIRNSLQRRLFMSGIYVTLKRAENFVRVHSDKAFRNLHR